MLTGSSKQMMQCTYSTDCFSCLIVVCLVSGEMGFADAVSVIVEFIYCCDACLSTHVMNMMLG